jgi:hypothetical protein
MSMPLYDGGVASGLFAGMMFGYVLEGAGFGSPRKLTAQFRLSDWSVFKVMFTAVIVAAAGLWLAEVSGMIPARSVYVPTLYFWAVAAGGALIGAGFAIGGYCPGTSVVGLASGRGDAFVFILGMVAGTWIFAAFFEPLEAFYMAAQAPDGQTVPALLGLPDWIVIVVLIVLAVGGWQLGTRLERARGGPVTAETILEERP